MNTGEALYQAVLESPEDDTPRLIYADWLEENGQDERAEFIRLQIQLARLPEADPGRAGLLARERKLLRLHGKGWITQLPAFQGIKWREFRRGFVEVVEVTNVKSFRAHAQTLFAAAPVRRGLFSQIRPRAAAVLAECPELARFTELESRGCLYAEGVASLVASPSVANLTTLLVGMNALLPEGVEAVAASGHLKRLQVLDLYHNAARDAGAIAVARSPHLTQLRVLNLGSNHLSPAGARALATSATLAGLTDLDLAHNSLEEEGLLALAAAPGWEDMRRLVVGGSGNYGLVTQAVWAALRERFGDRVRVW